jgi:hypothetical protein
MIDSAFLFLLFAVLLGFNYLLNALISSKITRKAKFFILGQALVSKQASFYRLNLAIALKSALLWLFLPQE